MCALAKPTGMGWPKGSHGPVSWALARQATVALGCDVAQVNSRFCPFLFDLNQIKSKSILKLPET
jgi:hypothetical protein